MSEKDYYNGWNDEGNLDKILPCPFCGGNGELLGDGYGLWIGCEKCGAMITGADTPEKAIEEWNRRV